MILTDSLSLSLGSQGGNPLTINLSTLLSLKNNNKTNQEDAEYSGLTTPDATFPPIQFNFLADHSRNEAYCLAIERVVAKMKREGRECHCLDMGAGSGLLAMMAARSGADSVVACDLHGSVCQTARHVIARNNLSSRVTVINRVSQPFSSSPLSLSSPLSPLPSPLSLSPLSLIF